MYSYGQFVHMFRTSCKRSLSHKRCRSFKPTRRKTGADRKYFKQLDRTYTKAAKKRSDGRFLKETALTPERLSQIRALNELAKKRGQTLAEMALSWILKDGDVTSVLIGASRPEQILDNIAIVGHTSFTPEELDAIDQITL